MTDARFDPITLEIMWSRLISIADEMWTTVLRTAVSTIIGAAQDFGCEILDAHGNSVAHSQRSMPVFNLVMPTTTHAVMERFPVETMQPGDVFITNDPWICAGHLDDIATVSPVFLHEEPGAGNRPVAFLTTIAHTSSIGGSLSPTTVRDIYEEGLRIPICKLYDAGRANEVVFAFIRENVRTPEMVLTDVEAQVTANALGVRRLRSFMREYGLTELDALAETVQARAEGAMRAAIRAVPNGVYENEMLTDGRGEPVRLRCRITVTDEEIAVDYAGSDPERIAGGINCCLIYTEAHTVYPLKCLLTPEVPANEGTYRPLKVTAPAGSILNCTMPASVNSRVNTGWHLHGLLFGALANALPDRVQAGNGLMHSLNSYGHGRNCFPSSARNVAVEIFELRVPVLIRERALLPNSAGAGEWRGAFGHTIVVSRLPGFIKSVDFYLSPNRLRFPPQGLAGGDDGPRTALFLNGQPLTHDDLESGHIALQADDDRLVEWLPGGAGFGDSTRRDPAAVEADRRSGLVTAPDAE